MYVASLPHASHAASHRDVDQSATHGQRYCRTLRTLADSSSAPLNGFGISDADLLQPARNHLYTSSSSITQCSACTKSKSSWKRTVAGSFACDCHAFLFSSDTSDSSAWSAKLEALSNASTAADDSSVTIDATSGVSTPTSLDVDGAPFTFQDGADVVASDSSFVLRMKLALLEKDRRILALEDRICELEGAQKDCCAHVLAMEADLDKALEWAYAMEAGMDEEVEDEDEEVEADLEEVEADLDAVCLKTEALLIQLAALGLDLDSQKPHASIEEAIPTGDFELLSIQPKDFETSAILSQSVERCAGQLFWPVQVWPALNPCGLKALQSY